MVCFRQPAFVVRKMALIVKGYEIRCTQANCEARSEGSYFNSLADVWIMFSNLIDFFTIPQIENLLSILSRIRVLYGDSRRPFLHSVVYVDILGH